MLKQHVERTVNYTENGIPMTSHNGNLYTVANYLVDRNLTSLKMRSIKIANAPLDNLLNRGINTIVMYAQELVVTKLARRNGKHYELNKTTQVDPNDPRAAPTPPATPGTPTFNGEPPPLPPHDGGPPSKRLRTKRAECLPRPKFEPVDTSWLHFGDDDDAQSCRTATSMPSLASECISKVKDEE